mgnify:CR=1 FL=1
MERNGFEIELRVLNDCTSKYPGLTFVGYYNIYPEKKKPYRLEDYFEFIHGMKHVDIGGCLKNGIKRGLGKIFDKHHDEVVDMYTGLVVSAHDNYKVSKDILKRPYEHYFDKTKDDVGYGDYVDEW